MPKIPTLLLIGVFSLWFATIANAHKVTIFAWAEGNTVYTQSKFSGGKMVRNGKVEVFDNQGKLLLEGRTDERGAFAFQTPAITDLNIVLIAGMGHRSTWRLSAAELGGETSVKAEGNALETDPAFMNKQDKSIVPDTEPGLTAEDVEKIVARQLEARLQPLTRMIAASQDQGPSLSDILGGIGYIIGLVGLGTYLRYRKERNT